MKVVSPVIPLLVLVTILLANACYATNERVDNLESTVASEITSLQVQQNQQAKRQQISEVTFIQTVTVINEKFDSADQRLSNLNITTNELAASDDLLRQHVSEIESELEARNINGILITWWQLGIVAAGIIIISILTSVIIYRYKSRDQMTPEV